MTKGFAAPKEARFALVTGAGSGLGRAIALRLARDGWHLALADVNLVGCRETAALVEQAGSTARVEELDVSQPDQWQQLVSRLQNVWPRLDLLVNNAGVASAGEVGSAPLADWNWTIDTNLLGTLYGCHACRDWLVRDSKQGAIVNVASVAAFASAPSMGAYNVSKAGVVALSETLFAELRGRGVSVTVVCAGFFPSRLLDTARFDKPQQRDSAIAWMQKSRLTVDAVADATVRAIVHRRLYVVLPARARLFWRLRRLMPATMMRFVAWLYHRGQTGAGALVGVTGAEVSRTPPPESRSASMTSAANGSQPEDTPVPPRSP